MNTSFENKDLFREYIQAMDLSNLATVAPHKEKFYERYTIDWLIDEVNKGTPLKYVTFWKADDGYENNMFSQWYKNKPFSVNGRTYITAEQYMMSEKALLFNDLDSYKRIMQESDPSKCKSLGRGVSGFVDSIWDNAFREILFHGNLGKLQSDINIVAALLETENAVLVEASPYDDKYGAGMSAKELLNSDGSLKILPENWHKKGSSKQAENNLGFVLMGIRDLFRQLMATRWVPGKDEEFLG